jgi:hypothetical protein
VFFDCPGCRIGKRQQEQGAQPSQGLPGRLREMLHWGF